MTDVLYSGGRARCAGLTIVFLLAAAALLGGCSERGDDENETPTAGGTGTPTGTMTGTETRGPEITPTAGPGTPTATATAPVEEMNLSVFFLKAEEVTPVVRTVGRTVATGRAAMEELLKGPNEQDQDFGMSTAVPEGSRLLGLSIENKIATVDLSREFESGGGSLSMQARLAQVVYTLTQFPTVDTVIFEIEGARVTTFGGEGIDLSAPVGPADFEDLTPILLVLTPRTGDTVSTPVRVTGTANAFEATFQLEVVDPRGVIVAEKTVTATSGTGTRGLFDVTVPFALEREGWGAIIVFELSPRDGSRTNLREIPVFMKQ